MKSLLVRWCCHAIVIPLIIVIGVLALPQTSKADVLKLVGGDKITGSLVSLSQSGCVFATKYQVSITVNNCHIVELETDTNVVVELKSGDRLIGTMSLHSNKLLTVFSPSIGPVKLPLDNVELIKAQRTKSKLTNVSKDIQSSHKMNEDEIGSSVKDSLKTIGSKEEGPPQTYLRDSAVLLAPGQIETTISALYEPQKRMDYILISGENGTLQYSQRATYQRTISLTGGLNIGITNHLEGWIQFPLGYTWMEENSAIGRSDGSKFGLMDISGGFRYLLLPESANWPEIIAQLSVTAPSGESPFQYQTTTTSLGDGYWKPSLGFSFVKSADPAVLFWGIGYGYCIPRDFMGYTHEPGGTFNYYGGMGFAINERLSASSKLTGGVRRELSIDGNEVPGSSLEPLAMSLGLSYRAWEHIIMEPMVIFGINNDANDATLGLTVSRKF